MNRFHGAVGYVEQAETFEGSGIIEDVVTEQQYYGDVVKDTRKLESGDTLHGTLKVGNAISIVADDYAIGHFHKIRYVEWAGERWTVTTVEQKHPRLLLYLGGIYNGPTP